MTFEVSPGWARSNRLPARDGYLVAIKAILAQQPGKYN